MVFGCPKMESEKKINQSQYTLIFIHILNFISLISEFYHSSFPSEFFFPRCTHSEISYVHSILKKFLFLCKYYSCTNHKKKTYKNSRKWVLLTQSFTFIILWETLNSLITNKFNAILTISISLFKTLCYLGLFKRKLDSF